MAKRKRESSAASPTTQKAKKRGASKAPASLPHPHGDFDVDKEYKVREIIGETKVKYHIAWENDSETGEAYPPTWEPKENANELAIADWEQKKAAKKPARGRLQAKPAIAKPQRQSTASEPAHRGIGRPRKNVIVDSSSVPCSSEPINSNETANKDLPEIGESQQSPLTDSTLSVLRESSAAESGPQSPQLRAREPTVQVPDPPSSFNRGAYQEVHPQFSSNGTASGVVNSSTSLPTISEGEISSQQHETDENKNENGTRVVPDSQSQGQGLEDSTFRGFSPTQPQQKQVASNSVESPEPQSQYIPSLTEEPSKSTELAVSEVHENNGFEAQASPGAEWPKSQEENHVETAQGAANSVQIPETQSQYTPSSTEEPPKSTGPVVSELDKNSGVDFQAPAGADRSRSQEEHHIETAQVNKNSAAVQIDISDQAPESSHDALNDLNGSYHSAANSSQALNNNTAALVETTLDQQSSVGTSPAKERSPTPEIYSQEQAPASSVQDEQLEESHIDSQEDPLPSLRPQSSPQPNDYIFISAEEVPPSTLDLLTQPGYNPPPAGQRPPPSSLLIEYNQQARGTTNIDTPTHRTVANLGSTQSSFPFETQQPVPAKTENGGKPRAVFTQHITSPRSSSQIPSLPSQSVITIGESAPARLVTPSPTSTAIATAPATMEPTSSTSGNPLLAQLTAVLESGKARRMARRSYTPVANASLAGPAASALPPNISAEVVASQVRPGDGGRSPSTVPASEPEPTITKEEMRTSGRLPTLVALAHGADSEGNHATLTVSGGLRSLHDDPEQANVHIVPIAFGNIQRDQYKNGFQWYKGEIQGFLDGDDSSDRFAKAEAALNELRDIAIHPDLINSEAYSQPLSTPEQAQWDVDASCKFRFLRDLMDQLRSQEKAVHVVVAAKGRVIPEMLGNFLQANGVSHARLSVEAPITGAAGLAVSILDLDAEILGERMQRADLVVAMDGASNPQDSLIQAARRSHRDNDWAALLVLVAPCTVEHIERSLLPTIAKTTRVRTLLNTALKLQVQGVAGRLTSGQASSKDAAIKIVSFLTNPTEWPIEELGTIDNLDSQTETDIDQTMNGDSSSASKRSLDADIDTVMGNAGKKPRGLSVEVEGQVGGTLPSTINPRDIDITHISDSMGKATQSALDDSGTSIEVEQLRRILSEKQDELQEHVKAMSDLQYRHEEQHVELAKTKSERDEAITTAQNAVTRMSIAANQSAELRTERTELKEMLVEANSKLFSHAIPERREFEELRLAMEQEKLARVKAEKRLEQAQKDSEYSRELYQDTSSRARELAQQNVDLASRLELAEKLASERQAKVQQATSNDRNKLLVKENGKLKALLRDREAGMKFRDEEIARLKEAGRGRMGTRGSSVPRTPRMGSPALKGRTSRQTSPTTGEVKGRQLHPLRNS